MPADCRDLIAAATAAILLMSAPVALAEEPGANPPEAVAQAEAPPVDLGEPERGQKAPPSALEEIVVTAEKRESLLQDTPIAVSAFGQAKMQDLVINNPADYVALVPSLSVRNSPNRVFIRGIGRVDNSLGLDPGVAIYTDGLYFAEHAPLFSSAFATERVEILRGPQGTLYGRSAVGGAMNVVSERPSEEFQAKARLIYGNYDRRDYAGIVSGPITDWLRYHVLVQDYKMDGVIENVAGTDFGASNGNYYRAQLEADLTDDITLWLKYDKSVYDNVDPGNTLVTPYITDQQPLIGSLSWNSALNSPIPNPGETSYFKVNRNDPTRVWCEDCYSLQAHLTWDLGPATLKALTGFRSYDWNYHGDYDNTSRFEEEFRYLEYIQQDHQYFSHELQLISQLGGKLEWQLGAYYYNEELEQPYTIHNPFNSNLAQVCLSCQAGVTWWDTSVLAPNVTSFGQGTYGAVYSQLGKLKSQAWSVYGEMYYSLTDTLQLTLGLRHNVDRKHGEDYQVVRGDARALYGIDYENGFLIPDCCAWEWSSANGLNGVRHRDRWKALTGRLVLDWTPDADTLIYASFSQGYKPGGFRLGPVTPGSGIDDEAVWAYELGLKRTFFDRLRIYSAAYYYVYEDMQVLRNFVVTDTAGANIIHAQLINADRTEIYGFELESELAATDNLRLTANYSYTHGEFEDFCCNLDTSFPDYNGNGIPNEPEDEQDLAGNTTPQTPKHKVSLGATYTWLTQSWGTFSLHGQWSWVDEQQYSIWDYPQDRADDFVRADAFLSWTEPEDRLKLIFYMKNLTDEEYLDTIYHIDANHQSNVRPAPPRTFGVEIYLTY